MILLVIPILVIFSATQSAHGMWFPLSPEELLEQSDTVFVGTVTAITPVDVEYESQIARDGTVKEDIGPETMTLEEYTISVEEFLKNPQETDIMKVLRATVGGVPGGPSRISGFEIGDRVLFYLPNGEEQTHFAGQYLPESFKIPILCDAKNVLMQPRIDGRNIFDRLQDGVIKHDNFTAGTPIEFVYKRDMGSLEGKSFDFQITIRKETEPGKYDETVLSEKIHAKSNSCEWTASAKAELVPQAGNYRTWVHIAEGTGGSSFSGSFSVKDHVKEKTIILPLKQFKSGVPISEIECKDDLVLLQKYDGTPACVREQTIPKLIERGWILDPANNTIKQCAIEYDRIMRIPGCPSSGDGPVCEPKPLIAKFIEPSDEIANFKKMHCADNVDEWSHLTEHEEGLDNGQIDWKLVSGIHHENPTFDVYGLNEKFQPIKVGKEIRSTIQYWDIVSCFDAETRIVDKLTKEVIFENTYTYKCKDEEVGTFDKMMLRITDDVNWKIKLPGFYVLEIESEKINLTEEFFVECISGGCEFLTDEQLEGRQKYQGHYDN